METLNDLEPLLRAFWYIAIPTSTIFLIQTVLTFIGLDSSDGIEADFDGNLDGAEAPFQLFSFRNLINFLLGLSWSGISFYSIIPNRILLISLSFAIGLGFIALFFIIIKQIQKLAENNTFKIDSTINKVASVYLRIPANRAGSGKIQISINGSYREIEAITDQDQIDNGSAVRIIKIEHNNLVLVEKI